MNERTMIAARLRVIADQIEAGTPEEESMKREMLDNIKKEFVKIVKDYPAYKDKDPEEIWKRIEPAIKVEVKRVFSSDVA
jgi:ClpP class serine protease